MLIKSEPEPELKWVNSMNTILMDRNEAIFNELFDFFHQDNSLENGLHLWYLNIHVAYGGLIGSGGEIQNVKASQF